MDWMTLTVEGIGFVILCVWIVLPIREFSAIFQRMRPVRPKSRVSEPPSVETVAEILR